MLCPAQVVDLFAGMEDLMLILKKMAKVPQITSVGILVLVEGLEKACAGGLLSLQRRALRWCCSASHEKKNQVHLQGLLLQALQLTSARYIEKLLIDGQQYIYYVFSYYQLYSPIPRSSQFQLRDQVFSRRTCVDLLLLLVNDVVTDR